MNALVDGYNLLYAIGLASRSLPAKRLARARTRLLDWLADRGEGHAMRVVFDGQGNSRPSDESEHRGVKVRYSFQKTADELIGELIRAERHPANLTIVSNDRQVQDAGRARGCVVLQCEEFTDALLAGPIPEPKPVETVEKPATEAEMAEWLEVFSKPKPRPPK